MSATEGVSATTQPEPIRSLFDILSYWVTIWGLVGAGLWVEHRVMAEFELPIQEGTKAIIFLVSTPIIFLGVMHCVGRNEKARILIDRIRHVAILLAAAGLGAYLQAYSNKNSYSARFQEGALFACLVHEACYAAAKKYAGPE